MATHWKPRPEASRPTLWDGLTALVILALALGSGLWLSRGEGSGTAAVISRDGEPVQILSLLQPGSAALDGLPYPLTLTVENGGVRVSQTDCPGQDCLHTGAISRPGEAIVCLPNHLVISIPTQGGPPVDGVTG